MGKPRYSVSWAVISACQTFRYILVRHWDESNCRRLVFVMLNPSKADAQLDDTTVRKCIGFAQRLGFGGIEIINLYAYRATKPADLKAAGWPVGPDNFNHHAAVLNMAHARNANGVVICAWGANARGRPEVARFQELALAFGVPLYALKRSADGTPHHPLMLPYSSKLELMQ